MLFTIKTEGVFVRQMMWKRSKKMIKEYDKVKTLVEKEGYPIGTIGIVVSLYATYNVCEVELWDSKDYPQDVVTYKFDEIEICKL